MPPNLEKKTNLRLHRLSFFLKKYEDDILSFRTFPKGVPEVLCFTMSSIFK